MYTYVLYVGDSTTLFEQINLRVSDKQTNKFRRYVVKCWVHNVEKRGTTFISKIHAIWEFSKIQ